MKILQGLVSVILCSFVSVTTASGQIQEFFFSSLTSGEIYRSPVEDPLATEIRGVQSVSATILAVDPEDRHVYVLDTETGGGELRRYDFGGTKATSILSGISFPKGLAIDTVNDKIYYSGGSLPAFIERCNFDGTNVERIVTNSNSTVELKYLRVDPVGGKIYWVEDDTNDTLRRADLADGANEEQLIDFGTSQTNTPIALDTTAGKIYYAFDASDEVWRANLDGTSEELIINSTIGPNVVQLEVDSGDGPTLYYVDNALNDILSFKVGSGTLTTVLDSSTGGFGPPDGLAIVVPVALTPGTQIDEAPAVDLIDGTRKVELTFRAFDGVDLTESAILGNGVSISAINILRYDATIRNVTTSAIRRVVTANTKATVKLPPGSYTASYNVRFGERRSNDAKKKLVEKAKDKISDLKSKPKTTGNLNKIQNQIAKKLLAPLRPSGKTDESPTTEAFTIPN